MHMFITKSVLNIIHILYNKYENASLRHPVSVTNLKRVYLQVNIAFCGAISKT